MAAATIKVVVVVGPAGSNTSNYIYNGKRYANVAREYGAKVIEIYSPNATWSRVRDALQGANLLIYLGHGNGWPSPYAPFRSSSKDGLGLNSSAGNGHYNVKYYGEYYIDRYIQMDKNAVVILNRLCYASAIPSGAGRIQRSTSPSPASTTTLPASCAPVRRPSSPMRSRARRGRSAPCSARTGRWTRSS